MNNMFKHLSKSVYFLLAFMLLFTSVPSVFSQEDDDRGEITEGTEYWFGIPHCRKLPAETFRNGEYPIMMWIYSKRNTQATVTDEAIG